MERRFGGWYIRGDIDYHWSDFEGADFITYGVDCCGLPVPGTNSFEKWLRVKIDAANAHTLANFWVERTGDLPDGVTPKDRGEHKRGEHGPQMDLVYRHAEKPPEDGAPTEGVEGAPRPPGT